MAEPLPHDQASELLPWLANGTLEAGERDAVRAHARNCVHCRRELDDLQALAAAIAPADAELLPVPDMRRINARIDAGLERERRGPALLAGMKWFAGSPWRLAFAVQTVVVIALAAVLLRPPAPEARYTTLSNPPSLPAGDYLRVVFDPGLEPAVLEALLGTHGLAIAAGPSERGVYTLSFARDAVAARREDVLAQLAADERVLFVQPAADATAP
ncbi:MAG TPA: zf-HC2 domain-containing protein [Woeseiaceae bacterium]|nr:zf-HC2 domain-containing protein [Woeseiaceae bacterium]